MSVDVSDIPVAYLALARSPVRRLLFHIHKLFGNQFTGNVKISMRPGSVVIETEHSLRQGAGDTMETFGNAKRHIADLEAKGFFGHVDCSVQNGTIVNLTVKKSQRLSDLPEAHEGS